MKKYIITIIILVIIMLLSIGGYFLYSNAKNKKSNSVDTLKEKCISEIEYLESSIIYMMNELNNISYSNYKITNKEIESSNSDENSISSENTINISDMKSNDVLSADTNIVDWDNLKKETENMYSTWTTVMMDLTTINVDKNNLLKYNNLLDDIVKDLEDKNKFDSLIHLADMYNLLKLYLENILGADERVNLYDVKSNILYAYAYVEKDDWDKVKEYILNSKQKFSNILNNPVNNSNKMDVINKIYILINELEQDSNKGEKKIFFINYKNIMQELENL